MLFNILAVIIIVASLLVVFSKNPVISALWLVVSLFAQAALFVSLSAYLVAVLQILLYAGAIMVLILFVVMMLNLSPRFTKLKSISGSKIILSLGVLYFLVTILAAIHIAVKNGLTFGVNVADGTVESVGVLLLTKYMVPFELLSVLLLSAIVGSIIISKK